MWRRRIHTIQNKRKNFYNLWSWLMIREKTFDSTMRTEMCMLVFVSRIMYIVDKPYWVQYRGRSVYITYKYTRKHSKTLIGSNLRFSGIISSLFGCCHLLHIYFFFVFVGGFEYVVLKPTYFTISAAKVHSDFSRPYEIALSITNLHTVKLMFLCILQSSQLGYKWLISYDEWNAKIQLYL